MFTAEEARNRANSMIVGKNKEQLTKIEKLVKDAVEKGELETHIYEYILKPIEEELTKLGYMVHPTTSFRNETMTKISWKKQI